MSRVNEAPGTIQPEVLYTQQAFMRQLGLCQATLRAARRAGLQVHYVHKRAFIHGQDWINYVLSTSRLSHCNSQINGEQNLKVAASSRLRLNGGASNE